MSALPLAPSSPERHLAAALAYAAKGWHVLPLQPRAKEPLTTHAFKDASTDPDRIRAWWACWPKANIGVSLEPSHLLVLDIDPRNGGSLEALIAAHGSLPDTLTNLTGGGGVHLLFRDPGGKVRGNVPNVPGVDVKNNAYIMVPPSIHPNGTRYRWEGKALADLPEHWLAVLRKSAPSRAEQSSLLLPDAANGALWLRKALERCGVGSRSATAHWLACQLRDNGITEGDAEPLMLAYAAGVPDPATYTEREALATLRSVYSSPAREPARTFSTPPPTTAGTPRSDEQPETLEPLVFPTARSPEVEELLEENRRIYALLQQRDEQLAEIRRIRALPDTIANATQKLVLMEYKDPIYELAPGQPGKVFVREVVAAHCGIALDTAGDAMTYCAERLDVVHKAPVRTEETDPATGYHTWRTLNTFTPSAQWSIADMHYVHPPRKPAGGKQAPRALVLCLKCGSPHVRDTTNRECDECHHKHAVRHDFPNGPQLSTVATNPEFKGERQFATRPLFSPLLSSQSMAICHSPLNSDIEPDEQQDAESLPFATVGTPMDELGGETCILCGAPVDLYDELGHAFCEAHAPPDLRIAG
jgi:Bifunctional DNA primase/polymerase, N-terminal